MKVLSIAVCLAAVAFVAVEAVPRRSGAHFVARMLHNNNVALLQRRGDPNSPECAKAIGDGRAAFETLNDAIQDYDDPAVDLTQAFQGALLHAFFNRDENARLAIEKTYSEARAAADNVSGEQGQKLRDALDGMISNARIAATKCQP